MMSKMQPTADYWTDDIKMTSKVQSAAELLNRWQKNPGEEIVLLWWEERRDILNE